MSDGADVRAGGAGLAHLQPGRPQVLGYSLVAGVAGLIPLPVVDDLASELVRSALLRRVAERRSVDVVPAAVRLLAAESDAPGWGRALTAAGLAALLARAWRRVFVLLAMARRADEIARTFLLGTLFEHYCARLHVGAALDARGARPLKTAIDLALRDVRAEALRRSFGRAAQASRRVVGRWPLATAARGRAGDAGEVGGDAAVRLLAEEPEGFVAKATRIFDEELRGGGEAYLVDLVGAFERAFAAARAAELVADAAEPPSPEDPDAARAADAAEPPPGDAHR